MTEINNALVRAHFKLARLPKFARFIFNGLLAFALGSQPILAVTSVPTITISPQTVILGPSQIQTFTAKVTITGTTPGIVWSITPQVGSISSAGLYTPPQSVTTPQSVTVKATTNATPAVSASAIVTLTSPVVVSVSPAIGTLNPSQVLALVSSVTGASNTAVTWSLKPNVGTISTSGGSAAYTAPSLISAQQVVTVTATSVANSSKSISVALTLVPLVTVTIATSAVTLGPSGYHQFAATETGAPNNLITWSLKPSVGVLSANGYYTAPATISMTQQVAITATSVADPTRFISAVVTLSPPSQQLQFSMDSYRLTSLSYKGQSFYQYVASVVQGAIYQKPDGTTYDAGWTNPSSVSQPNGPLSFQQIYNSNGPYKFTLNVTMSATDSRTVKAVATVTNNDPVNTLSQISLHLMSLNLPGPSKFSVPVGQPLYVNQYFGDVVTLFSGSWGSVGSWITGYPTAVDQWSYYTTASQTSFANAISNYTVYSPNTYKSPLPPGTSLVMTQMVRFGEATDTAVSLAPEPYAEYRSIYPYLVNWPDRRPIAYWLISDVYNGRSASNPRGYFWDKTINALNASAFQTKAMAEADSTLAVLNRISPKPQGLIVWDLEGQEFNQSFSYVGYPNYLPLISPEMDAVADQLIGKITAAGYRIGVTIRPNRFLAGTQLPATCSAGTNTNLTTQYDLADKFIKTDATYPLRGYVCIGNAWAPGTANHPSAQATTQDYSQVLSLLEQKIAYAKGRWGASLFYIDSDVWETGGVIDPSIFRQLAAQFPDCLLIPETAGTFHFGATAPYEAANAFNYFGTSQTRRDLYPGAFGAINIADADTSGHFSQLVKAVASGDLLMFRGWFSAPEIPALQQIYAAAANQQK